MVAMHGNGDGGIVLVCCAYLVVVILLAVVVGQVAVAMATSGVWTFDIGGSAGTFGVGGSITSAASLGHEDEAL
eukprot:9732216-Ditylum_brightwellii.AAC.1